MKVAILAGGYGRRMNEETLDKPKAMVRIGAKPVLWHIMMHYYSYSFNDFIIALGHKGQEIRNYFNSECPLEWIVDLIDTGLHTQTGGRIKKLSSHLGKETFMLTWCDGISDINIKELLAFHRSHGKLATVTAVNPPSRFGCLRLDGDCVVDFSEKPKRNDEWINGAFFVLEPGVFDYIDADHTIWEEEPLQRLAKAGQLMAFKHASFWQCMDTQKDRMLLEDLWQSGNPPWRVKG